MWVPLYHLASTWLQLPPSSTWLYMQIVPSKLHFTLHPRTMLNDPLSPNVADLQHFDIEFFVASLFATLFAQEPTLLQLV